MDEVTKSIRKCSYNPGEDMIPVGFETEELYLEVKYRQFWFQLYCQENGIEGMIDAGQLEVIPLNDRYCIAKSTAAIIMDGMPVSKVAASRFVEIGDPDQIQGVVTLAIGRALNAAGFGTVTAFKGEHGAPYPVDAGVKLVRNPDRPAEFVMEKTAVAEKHEAAVEQKNHMAAVTGSAAVREQPRQTKPQQIPEPAQKPSAAEEKPMSLNDAYRFIVPIGTEEKGKGRTISEVMGSNPGIIAWYASDSFNPEKGSQENRAIRRQFKQACSIVTKAAACPA